MAPFKKRPTRPNETDEIETYDIEMITWKFVSRSTDDNERRTDLLRYQRLNSDAPSMFQESFELATAQARLIGMGLACAIKEPEDFGPPLRFVLGIGRPAAVQMRSGRHAPADL